MAVRRDAADVAAGRREPYVSLDREVQRQRCCLDFRRPRFGLQAGSNTIPILFEACPIIIVGTILGIMCWFSRAIIIETVR